jgi:hypothetical protein
MIHETSETTYEMALNGFKLNDICYLITIKNSMGFGTYTRTIDGDYVQISEELGNLNYIFDSPKSRGYNNVYSISISNKRVRILFIPPNMNNNRIAIEVEMIFSKEINAIALANLLIGYRKNIGTENDQLRNLKYITINNCTLDLDKTDIIRKILKLPETTKIIINK